MRLFDAIIDANHRALAGDSKAGVRVADFTDQLPVVALTCIDPRLNRFFPGVLGLPEEQFIWLRNAGNVITGPLSSTMRSLALACVVKDGREIAIIGHTDCGVRKTTVSQLTDRLKTLGIERQQLPQNLVQFFGLFASERQNVISGVDFVRQSPLISARIPVHGLMVETETGKLQWVVNGYEVLDRPGAKIAASVPSAVGDAIGQWANRAVHEIEGLTSSQTRIGQVAAKIGELITTAKSVVGAVEIPPQSSVPAPGQTSPPVPAIARPPAPPLRPIPVPPPIQPMPRVRRR